VGFIKQSVIEELKRDLTQSYNWKQKSEKVAQTVIKIPDAHKANIQNFVKKFDEFYKSDENEHVIDNIQMFERRILTNILESK
uniref:Uncharacterized protein n=1 Tax=Romanomermis culicivorax TaxID=13658 RepID=A0A915KWU9_ROMCU